MLDIPIYLRIVSLIKQDLAGVEIRKNFLTGHKFIIKDNIYKYYSILL